MRLLPLAYVLVGAFVAAAHHYFAHAGSPTGVGSAIVAILTWPLVLAGVHLSIR